MAIQILPPQQTAGYAFGTGLGQGLSSLVQNKLSQMQQSRTAKEFSDLLQKSGVDERDANILGWQFSQNPQHFHQFLDQYSPRMAQQAQQIPQEAYQQALGQMGQQEQAIQQQPIYRQPSPEQVTQLGNLFRGLGLQQQSGLGQGVDLLRQQASQQLLKTAVGQEEPQQERQAQRQAIAQARAQEQLPQQIQRAAQAQAPQIQQQIPANIPPEKVAEIHPLVAKKEAAKKAEERKTEAEAKKEQTAINKAEKPYIDKVTAYKEAADDAEKRLDKMETLVKRGNLPYSGYYNTLKSLEEHVTPLTGAGAGAAIGGALGLAGGPLAPASATIGSAIGGGIGAAVTPIVQTLKALQRGVTATDTEEFEKLSNDFVRNAKAIFGSRITDADLRTFMSTVPTLSQTDEGKLAVIKNMKSFNKAAQARYKAMRDIIKENGNKIPADIQFEVEDRAKPELDKIAQEFIA